MEIVGTVITVIAVAGVLLNNHRRRECFYLWLVSNLLSASVHLTAGMYAMTARDLIFFALAIHGLIHWSRPRSKKCEK